MAAQQAAKGTENLDKELSEFNENQPAPPKKARATKKAVGTQQPKKAPKRKKNAIVTRGKRKRAIARATIAAGNGNIRINGISAQLIHPKEIRDLILEPIIISKKVSDTMKDYDVSINVYGGGTMGQAQASRTALAKAIVGATKNEGIKAAYMQYDRSLLVEDHRRVEPKKAGGPKARARNQTSYR